MGYDDLKVVEASRLVQSIATGKPQGATVEDARAAAESLKRCPSRPGVVAG
jgi:hypothetical protein